MTVMLRKEEAYLNKVKEKNMEQKNKCLRELIGLGNHKQMLRSSITRRTKDVEALTKKILATELAAQVVTTSNKFSFQEMEMQRSRRPT